MSIWYKTANYSNQITAVDVISETPKFVEVKGIGRAYREAKISSSNRFFPSKIEALTYLVTRYTKEIESLRKKKHAAESALGQVNAALKAEMGEHV